MEPLTGLKLDNGKPKWDLISWEAVEQVAITLTIGAKKYGERNWELGITYSRLFAALLRHLFKWWRGEERDPEDGQHHMAAVMTNAMMLMHYDTYKEKYKDWDNRPCKQEKL